MSRRFVVIVLDGFGIGAMEDAYRERPGDEKANTLGSILKDHPDLYLPNLERLGLMNAFGLESSRMKFSREACFGRAELKHFGADTFMGHQEIMGTLPKKPEVHPFQEKVQKTAEHLRAKGHRVQVREREGLRYLVCDDYVTVGDNLEADLGMCYNVTAPLDFISFQEECEIARLVREVATVGRVIVFGGTGNTMEDLYKAEEVREERFIGIASAKSKSYEQGYQCLHLGYGVDKNVQVPTLLSRAGIPVTLIGKVADIVANDGGKSISCVPTRECLRLTLEELRGMEQGFICTNVQETDLAGHSQSTSVYRQILEEADEGIGTLLEELTGEDLLIVMADHGNDPKIGHSKHTRECVPLLLYQKGRRMHPVGIRKSLSDVGASVCDYFGVCPPQNGESFLHIL
ncbi:MAG: phosphopentomutase [Lachnospiraceae bacterium]|jgi:phosphopentomutase|nr:phosphopentomutase [Lachnospiraceae bacterium]